ncbi:MAG: hypothetical protein HY093_00090 [Candidatus Liptonbacteria bacterium]|nr:hypothetical protein [Candidatus Liptonbacteria bacterium]
MKFLPNRQNNFRATTRLRSGSEARAGREFIFPTPLFLPAPPEPKSRRGGINSAPAALLVQSRTQQKSFLFLLEEKIGRTQNKKCRENFFAGWRAKRAAAGRSVRVRNPDFRQKKFGF